MILYIEKQARNFPLTKRICEKFPHATIIEIQHYKNIFDKPLGGYPTENCLILARLVWDHISSCPPGYDPYDYSFFFKTSLNCVYDCEYCYLKWAFRNDFRVIFVNYDEIMGTIEQKISSVRAQDPHGSIIFYASDYSDIQALDTLTDFNAHFIPFFDRFPGVIVESRTKSANITSLLGFEKIPENFEIAFSLNPEEIIRQYEHKSASLEQRMNAVNTMIDRGYKVGLRFLPLLPVPGYLDIYETFLKQVRERIPLERVHSFSIGSLLYTREDYKQMLKKIPNFDMLYRIESTTDDNFVRLPLEVRVNFYKLFEKYLGDFSVCLDGKIVVKERAI